MSTKPTTHGSIQQVGKYGYIVLEETGYNSHAGIKLIPGIIVDYNEQYDRYGVNCSDSVHRTLKAELFHLAMMGASKKIEAWVEKQRDLLKTREARLAQILELSSFSHMAAGLHEFKNRYELKIAALEQVKLFEKPLPNLLEVR